MHEMQWFVGLVLITLASCLPLREEKKWYSRPELETDDEKCIFCLATVNVIQDALQSNKTLDDIYPYAEKLCIYAINSSGGAYMCPGLIHSYGPVFQYVATNVILEDRSVCEMIHLCNQTSIRESTTQNLKELYQAIEKYKHNILKEQASVDVSAGDKYGKGSPSKLNIDDHDALKSKHQPESINLSTRHKLPVRPHDGKVTFLQLSDIHLDHDYSEGSPSDCDLYMCCRRWYNGTGSAGHYGAYNCDLPHPTLDLLLETIQNLQPQPDFIVYTGDNPPHDVWNETWSSQLEATQYIVQYLAQKLPNIPIYPAIGNHESWPESEYLGTLPEYQILTGHLAEYWQKWVSFSPDELNTIAEGGYYSLKIMEGLRLISFNSNYGYTLNFYSFLNPTNDLYTKQWDWIIKELTVAERNNEKVIIIAHIPPGDSDNHPEYGDFYLNMTRQFSQTITAHLFGHTHRDHFQLVKDDDGVYGVVLIAPSVTPRPHINPSFRLFTLNASNFQLSDYKQFHLNLTKANELYTRQSPAPPVFEFSYSPLEQYGLQNLSPKSWEALVQQFSNNSELLNQYNYNMHARSQRSDLVCDTDCKKQLICYASNIVSANYHKCLEN